MKYGNRKFLEPSGSLQACNGTALPFFFFYCDEYSVLILLIIAAVSIYFTVLQIEFKFHLGFLSSEAWRRATGYIQEERKPQASRCENKKLA